MGAASPIAFLLVTNILLVAAPAGNTFLQICFHRGEKGLRWYIFASTSKAPAPPSGGILHANFSAYGGM
jgi:hypothetical protein